MKYSAVWIQHTIVVSYVACAFAQEATTQYDMAIYGGKNKTIGSSLFGGRKLVDKFVNSAFDKATKDSNGTLPTELFIQTVKNSTVTKYKEAGDLANGFWERAREVDVNNDGQITKEELTVFTTKFLDTQIITDSGICDLVKTQMEQCNSDMIAAGQSTIRFDEEVIKSLHGLCKHGFTSFGDQKFVLETAILNAAKTGSDATQRCSAMKTTVDQAIESFASQSVSTHSVQLIKRAPTHLIPYFNVASDIGFYIMVFTTVFQLMSLPLGITGVAINAFLIPINMIGFLIHAFSYLSIRHIRTKQVEEQAAKRVGSPPISN